MSFASFAALFGTLLVLAVTPGPSDVAVVSRSLTAGFKQSLWMVGGIVVADVVFIVLAVYGLTELASYAALFALVKYACGAYLIFMGLSAFKPQPKATDAPRSTKGEETSSFFAGLLLTLGDPKAILFYMGLLPAFVDMSSVFLGDTLLITLVAVTVVGGVKTVYAYLAERAKRFFENDAARRRLERVAGGVLVCTGLLLLLTG